MDQDEFDDLHDCDCDCQRTPYTPEQRERARRFCTTPIDVESIRVAGYEMGRRLAMRREQIVLDVLLGKR